MVLLTIQSAVTTSLLSGHSSPAYLNSVPNFSPRKLLFGFLHISHTRTTQYGAFCIWLFSICVIFYLRCMCVNHFWMAFLTMLICSVHSYRRKALAHFFPGAPEDFAVESDHPCRRSSRTLRWSGEARAIREVSLPWAGLHQPTGRNCNRACRNDWWVIWINRFPLSRNVTNC